MKKGGGSAPQAPNPMAVAESQTQQNRDAALFNAALNRTNTYSPMGSQEFTQTGVDPQTGAPITRQDIKLDPQTEALYRQQMGLSQQFGEMAGGMASRLPTSPFSFSGLPGRSDLNGIRGNAQDALYARNTKYLDPQFERGEDKLRTRLANQGVVEGSEAYKNAYDDFSRSKDMAYSGARNDAVIGSGAEADRAFSMDEQLRRNMMSEMLTERQMPYDELGRVTGMMSPAELPQFQGPSQYGASPADISGAMMAKYQGDIDAYNARTGSKNNLMGGLFSLGSAYLGSR
jgi:hypothetical protein